MPFLVKSFVEIAVKNISKASFHLKPSSCCCYTFQTLTLTFIGHNSCYWTPLYRHNIIGWLLLL